MPTPQELPIVWTWPAEKLFEELEKLIQKKGMLRVTSFQHELVSSQWSASLGDKWPYCSHSSLLNVIRTLVHTHLQLEKEELQRHLEILAHATGL